MQVEAIYRDGRVELLQPLRLKRDNVRVLVTIPREEIEQESTDQRVDTSAYDLSPEVIEGARQFRARMDAILNAPLPPDDGLPDPDPGFEERMEAMELRAALRKEQGRPA